MDVIRTNKFGKLIVDETEKWGKVIKFAGIKPQYSPSRARSFINRGLCIRRS